MKLERLKVHMIYGSIRVDCDTRFRPFQLGDLSVIRILYAQLTMPKCWLWDTQQDNQSSCSAINIDFHASLLYYYLYRTENSPFVLSQLITTSLSSIWYINGTESVSVFGCVRTTMLAPKAKRHNRSSWQLTGNSLRAQNESSRHLKISPLVRVFFIIFKESIRAFCPNG